MDKNKPLFHYTSVEGFLGIVSSKTIWATNILYLNDASEFNYSKELLRNELFEIRKKGFNINGNIETSIEPRFFEIVEENIDKLIPSQNFSFFVCSFSEEKDLLSQWRGYCSEGIGFSLGFSKKLLIQCAEQSKFALKPCLYDEEAQAQSIRDLIKKTSDRFRTEIKNSSQIGKAWDTMGQILAVDFMLEFIALAPTFKHHKFCEEKEWRIVASLQMNNVNELIKFRSGRSMIIPYIEIYLPTKDRNLTMDEIVVGPTTDDLLSMASVEMILRGKEIEYNELSYSTIPYRPW
ncbi:MAG: DUF2971 domain-containing protein [Deltaproteobacteria bacterium]|jgi:hypothetical protein|nr:DUF2971 domain-containing protein [Deltaproteobacteria bacterium]